ncbi:MAG: PepSY domain-containing protein [Planctomycetes bacterium]|nr:PepSY domain-containing protein [Planctomycetota bacterium]
MRRLHRVLGSLLVLPLVVWIATGVLFHVKHRYDEAYEALAVPPERTPDWASARLAPADVLARAGVEPPLVLAVHPSGALAYFARRAGAPVALDAASGAELAIADEAGARRWITAALARSPHVARHGELVQDLAPSATNVRSMRTGVEDPALVFETTGAKRITVDLVTGELTQTGELNDFIDATYALHYLQWTPWSAVNVALVLVALPLVLLLAGTGVRLVFAKSRADGRSAAGASAEGRTRSGRFRAPVLLVGAGGLAVLASLGGCRAPAAVPGARSGTESVAGPETDAADETSALRGEDVEAREQVLRTLDELYAAFCFDAGGEADWETLRELAVAGAVWFAPCVAGEAPRPFDTARFLADFRDAIRREPGLVAGFHERIVHARIDTFGGVAHAWVAFEGFVPGTTVVRTRGLDSIQLLLDRGRWRVASFTTQYESHELTLPRRFVSARRTDS